MMMKICSKCGETKPLSEYAVNKACRYGKRPECKVCMKEFSRKWWLENREIIKTKKKTYYEKNKEKIQNQHRDYIARNKDAVFIMHQNYRNNNKEKIAAWWEKSPRGMIGKGLQMALKRRPTQNAVTVDELMDIWKSQDGKCVVSGLIMTWRKGKTQPTSISIDRIDSKLDYTKNNVRLVCYQVNSFKNRWSDEQMLSMATSICNHNNPEKMHWIESNDDDRAWIQ